MPSIRLFLFVHLLLTRPDPNAVTLVIRRSHSRSLEDSRRCRLSIHYITGLYCTTSLLNHQSCSPPTYFVVETATVFVKRLSKAPLMRLT
ncbi:hypothetical protein K474DRAFT_1692109 [Panus rudis PR-1116 ss-1]|nr:hypothetical protein K474DRAFT_1692109 [Panus rudis PR-1116 ss-1]